MDWATEDVVLPVQSVNSLAVVKGIVEKLTLGMVLDFVVDNGLIEWDLVGVVKGGRGCGED